MAYPSDNQPRRRKQAVPTMSQMIRRRAASPSGIPKAGVGKIQPRRMPQGNAWGVKARQQGTTRGAQMSQQQRQRRLTSSNQQYEDTFGFPNQQLQEAYQRALTAWGPDSTETLQWKALLDAQTQMYRQGQLGSQTNMPELIGGGPGPQYEGGGQPGKDPTTEAQGNPLDHQRYWAAQGWIYNPRDQRFDFVGDKALEQYLQSGIPVIGGRPNPEEGGTGNATNGDRTIEPWLQDGMTGSSPDSSLGTSAPTSSLDPVTAPTVPPAEPSTDLPLDPYYEQQRRLLQDAYTARMGQIAPQREQVLADRTLQEARLGTNEGVDTRRMLESLAGRGAFGGGIQARDQGYLSTDYLRQRQDLATNVANALSQLSMGESEAGLQLNQGLMEALLELANRQAMSEYAVTPQPDTTELPYEDWFGSELPPPTTGGGGGGGGASGGGGGGGGWEPSWKPTWKPTWEPDKKRRRR